MPFLTRIAGLDLSLGGAPHADHVTQLSTSCRSSNLSVYPSRGQSHTASPDGYRINSLTRTIGYGRESFKRASRALETADILTLPWVRFWRKGLGSRWANGDVVVVAARLLPFVWIANVNRVVNVHRGRAEMAVAWGTTKRHVLKGEETVAVRKKRNGEVMFELRSFSKPNAVVAWWTYPVVVAMQVMFARGVHRQLEQIAREED